MFISFLFHTNILNLQNNVKLKIQTEENSRNINWRLLDLQNKYYFLLAEIDKENLHKSKPIFLSLNNGKTAEWGLNIFVLS